MRFIISVIALAAAVSAQGVQTISQIGDGQIQAPPATATAPPAASPPAVSPPAVSPPAESAPPARSPPAGQFDSIT